MFSGSGMLVQGCDENAFSVKGLDFKGLNTMVEPATMHAFPSSLLKTSKFRAQGILFELAALLPCSCWLFVHASKAKLRV